MKKQKRKLYHGGVSGLSRGDLILPGMAERRYVPGCPHCEAQRRGETLIDPPTPSEWVYATHDWLYARYYASRAVRGDLYVVEPVGPVEASTEDLIPTVHARSLRVLRVQERGIELTWAERRYLFVTMMGGTDQEFDEMVEAIVASSTAAGQIGK
jgi:hypothetical protein